MYVLRGPIKFIKYSQSVCGTFSSVKYIYLNRDEKRYYISHDRNAFNLNNAQMITREDIINKKVKFGGTYWKI